jgi:HAE1 family hydrophobic/amphiphilic exporter-1
MFISDTAIKRPVLTVVAMLIIVVFGIVALLQLDTD